MKTPQPILLDMKSLEYEQYRAELLALVPINSSEKAAQYRELWERFYHAPIFPEVTK